MSGYRFCRTDDVPLLVDACNRCYDVHFVDEPPMSLAVFKRDTRELNVWASSCMVALAGDAPVGVMLSAKRDAASLIHRIGVHPEHQRRGHGRHLLSSLSRKLSILGPPRLAVEIPLRASTVRRFFEACGYEEETRYADFVWEAESPRTTPESDLTARSRAAAGTPSTPSDRQSPLRADAIVSITLDDVLSNGAFDETRPRAWERSLPTLRNRADQLDGLAFVSDVRIEAHLFHRSSGTHGAREIVALGSAPGDHGTALLGILVEHLCTAAGGGVSIPRVSEAEIDTAILEAWGFRRTREYVGYATTAAE